LNIEDGGAELACAKRAGGSKIRVEPNFQDLAGSTKANIQYFPATSLNRGDTNPRYCGTSYAHTLRTD
jgi:hypothetical protein